MKSTWLDRAIAWIDPGRGAMRMAARAQATMLGDVYDGASASARNSSRRYRAGDANTAVIAGGKRLRYAARDLERNNPLASRGFSVLKSNVIGAGIIPSVAVPTTGKGVKSGSARDALQLIVNAHCDTTRIDQAGRQTLYGLQGVAFRAAVRDGAALIVRRRAKSTERLPLPFQIAVLEIDYLNEVVHGPQPNGNVAILGIEFSPLGAPVAYHILNRHPGDTAQPLGSLLAQTTRYDAADVVHLYRIDRPGQAHGVSWIAPVIVRLGDFEDTKDAYILRQKIAACFSVFITKTDAAGQPVNTTDRTASGQQIETVEPGMIEYLKPGEGVSFASPPAVLDLEAFFRVNSRDIAVGLGMTYEALTGDLSNVNFSSGRMGWLEFHRNIAAWTEDMVIPQLCQKVGGWIVEGLNLMAVVPDGTTINWTPPRREMIDPAAELKAAAQAARDGLGTTAGWLRSMGYDPEKVDQERAAEIERQHELGLTYDTDISTATVQAENAANTPPNPEQKVQGRPS